MAQLHIDRLFYYEPEKVWQVLSDFEANDIKGISVKILEPGDKGSNHAGLVREIRMNGKTIREKILTVTPIESIEYQLLAGVPAHDFFGTIFLYPERNGTTVRWVVTFKTSFPWPEWIVKKRTIKNINHILDELEKELKIIAGGKLNF